MSEMTKDGREIVKMLAGDCAIVKNADGREEFVHEVSELGKDPDEVIPVMRWSQEGLPDLFVKSTKNLGTTLRETFLGESEEWKDDVGKTLTMTVEMMRRGDFDALEGWEP